MRASRTARWLSSNIAALGSAAVLSVYAAGYVRTRGAAERFANEGSERRPPAPRPVSPLVVRAAPSSPTIDSASVPAPAHTAPVAPNSKATPPSAAAQKPAPELAPPKDSAPVSTPTPPAPAAPITTPLPASTATPAPIDSSAKSQVAWKDGTYSGWGTSRHGDIQATVSIKDGKIIYASITECRTQYSCSWIAQLPPQVVARQSADVDYVSGATQSSNAFYYAVLESLKQAK